VHTAGMSEHEDKGEAEDAPQAGSERFKHLPEPVKLEDTVESQETEVARDPDGGRDPERDFMIRWAGGAG
jgi:hypothetical protein